MNSNAGLSRKNTKDYFLVLCLSCFQCLYLLPKGIKGIHKGPGNRVPGKPSISKGKLLQPLVKQCFDVALNISCYFFTHEERCPAITNLLTSKKSQ